MKIGLLILIIHFIQSTIPLSNNLNGTNWNLVSITTLQSIQFADTICRATLSFENKEQYGGYSGCNTFGCKYSFNENGKLTMDRPTATKRGCTQPCMFGERLFDSFPKVNKFILHSDSLILMTTDRIRIVYKKQ